MFFFTPFFFNLTNLNSGMVFIHFITCRMQFSFLIFEGSLPHKKKIDKKLNIEPYHLPDLPLTCGFCCDSRWNLKCCKLKLLPPPEIGCPGQSGNWHFKVAGAILPPLQNGRQSLIFGPIWKRTWPLDSPTPKNYINIYITGLRHLFNN